jgi:DNA-binding LacI/PurR family transcriptional regulator
MDRMQANAHRMVSMHLDLSDHGIVSADNSRPQWSSLMVDHMVKLGHDRVDCLNTQPGTIVQHRINAWQSGVQHHNIQGKLWDQPVENFQVNWIKAYHIAKAALADGSMARAVFCPNVQVAKGLYRAAHELGMVAGKDIFYCCVGAAAETLFEVPSITTLQFPPMDSVIQQAVNWLERGDKALINGNRCLFPDTIPQLLLGESTGHASFADQIPLTPQ